MLLAISGVLSADDCSALRQELADLPFRPGADTTANRLKAEKTNDHADAADARVAALKRRLADRIGAHPVVAMAARPKTIPALLINRYRAGQRYGSHTDDPVIGGTRIDLSFTLALSDPEDYAGGALVLEEVSGPRSFRLPAGSLLLYDSGVPHRVEAVTEGERFAAVGWVRSTIRDPRHRELLFELDRTRHEVAAGADPDALLRRLGRISNDLIRLWVED